MAIWQFSIDFIPRNNLVERFGEIPAFIDEEILWSENLEEGVKLPIHYENFLDTLGKKDNLKWRQNSFNWGDYDNGNHITISCQEADKVSVICRLHVGDWDEVFVETMLNFAQACDCLLLTKNRTIIKPEVDLLINEVRNSNSYRFCKNPIEYLQSDEVKQLNWNIRKKISE